MSLIPDLEALLADAVERHPLGRPAATPRRAHGRRSRRLGLGVLVATAAFSGVAYASQGLWRPVMGDATRGHAAASASPLPQSLLAHYGLLRRPQDDKDRGAGSQEALRWQGGGEVIQTAGVRRAGTGYKHTAIVVIPFARTTTGTSDRDGTSELCLWQQDPAEAGGMSCSGVDAAIEQGVTLTTIDSPPLSAAKRMEFRDWLRSHPGGGAMPKRFAPSAGIAHVAGLVPDGVATVVVGGPGHATTSTVHNNLYQATVPEQASQTIVWQDDAGQTVAQKRSND